MIRHAWSVIANRHGVAEGNVLDVTILESLSGEVPGTAAPGTRLLIPHAIEVISLWYRTGDDPARTTARVRCFDPEGQELGRIPFDVEVPLEHRHMRTITQMDTVPYTRAGTYEYAIEAIEDGQFRELTRLPLELDIRLRG